MSRTIIYGISIDPRECGGSLPVYTNYPNDGKNHVDIVVKITEQKHNTLKEQITGLMSYSNIGNGKFHYRVKTGDGGIENERGLYQLIKKICDITQEGGKRKPNSRKRKTGRKRRSRRRGGKSVSK